MHKKYSAQGLTVIGVAEDDTVPQTLAFARDAGWLDADVPAAVDENATVRRAYGVRMYPTLVLVGRDGNIAWRSDRGAAVSLEDQIETLLDAK